MSHGTFELTFYPAQKDCVDFPVTAIYRPAEERNLTHRRVGGNFRNDEALQRQILDAQFQNNLYGKILGQAVFQGALREFFLIALADTPPGEPLHVLLSLDAESLRELRWERLQGPLGIGNLDWDFLALDQRTTLSVYVAGCSPQEFPPVGLGAIQALVLVASPKGAKDAPEFDVQQTADAICGGLDQRFTVLARNVLGARGLPTLDTLLSQLRQERATVLHIVAHGTYPRDIPSFCLILEKEDGTADRIPGSVLLKELGRLASSMPYLVFLSTCASALPGLTGHHRFADQMARDLALPAVIGMADVISIESTKTIAEAFYKNLRLSGRPEVSLSAARVGLMRAHDVLVPVLVSQLGGRPLFDAELDAPPANAAAFKRGLDRLGQELELRAPVLCKLFNKFREHPPQFGSPTWEKDLAKLNNWSDEAVGVSFNGLCAGHPAPPYRAQECPFNGMKSFDFERRAYFKARERLVEDITSRLRAAGVLTLVGPSGSGKSSLIFAGVLPRLELTSNQFVNFSPGIDPLGTLERCLANAQPTDLLIVDQFEELFTHPQTAEVRTEFIQRLSEEKSRRRVIITLRSEFRHHLDGTWLEALVNNKSQDILPMSTDELRRATEEQAAEVGLRFEADLVTLILEEVKDEPGAMPLLQHTLRELWRARRGVWLRTKVYRDELGGVQMAVAQTANDFLNKLSPAERDLVADLFLRLTRVAEETEIINQTRRRALISELIPAGKPEEPTRGLLSQLTNEYLVITSGKEAEVAHEALIRHWQTLGEWIRKYRPVLLLRQNLNESAREWEKTKHHCDSLSHRGDRLKTAFQLQSHTLLRLNRNEVDYLKACVDSEQKVAEEVKRAAASKRRNRLLVVVAMFAIMLGLGGWAMREFSLRTKAAAAERMTRWARYPDQIKLAYENQQRHPVKSEKILAEIRQTAGEDLRGFEWYHLNHALLQTVATIGQAPTTIRQMRYLVTERILAIQLVDKIQLLRFDKDPADVPWHQIHEIPIGKEITSFAVASDRPVIVSGSNREMHVIDASSVPPKVTTIPLPVDTGRFVLDEFLAVNPAGNEFVFYRRQAASSSGEEELFWLGLGQISSGKIEMVPCPHRFINHIAFRSDGLIVALADNGLVQMEYATNGVRTVHVQELIPRQTAQPVGVPSLSPRGGFLLMEKPSEIKLLPIKPRKDAQDDALDFPLKNSRNVLHVGMSHDDKFLFIRTEGADKNNFEAAWFATQGKNDPIQEFKNLDYTADILERPFVAGYPEGNHSRFIWGLEQEVLRAIVPNMKLPAVLSVSPFTAGIESSSLSWSPSGNELLIVQSSTPQKPNENVLHGIFIIDPDKDQNQVYRFTVDDTSDEFSYDYPQLSDSKEILAGYDSQQVEMLRDNSSPAKMLLEELFGQGNCELLGFVPGKRQVALTRQRAEPVVSKALVRNLEVWNLDDTRVHEFVVSTPCYPGKSQWACNNRYMAFATAEELYIWKMDPKISVHSVSKQSHIMGVKLLSDGKHLALQLQDREAAGAASELQIRELESGAVVCKRSLPFLGFNPRFSLHPSGRQFATCLYGSLVEIWSIGPWEEVDWDPQQIVSIDAGQEVRILEFSPTGEALAVGLRDHSVNVWRAPGLNKKANE